MSGGSANFNFAPVINVSPFEKLNTELNKLMGVTKALLSGNQLHKYWGDEAKLINNVTEAYKKYTSTSGRDNGIAQELLTTVNALKGFKGGDISGLFKEWEDMLPAITAVTQKFGGAVGLMSENIFSDFKSVEGLFKATGDNIIAFSEKLSRIEPEGNLEEKINQLQDIIDLQKLELKLERERYESLESGSTAQMWEQEYYSAQEKLEKISKSAKDEFDAFLQGNGITNASGEAILGSSQGIIDQYRKKIENMEITAKQASVAVRGELSSLFDSGSGIDTDKLDIVLEKINQVFDLTEKLNNKIQGSINGNVSGGIADSMASSTEEASEILKNAVNSIIEQVDRMYDETSSGDKQSTKLNGIVDVFNAIKDISTDGAQGLTTLNLLTGKIKDLDGVKVSSTIPKNISALITSFSSVSTDTINNVRDFTGISFSGLKDIKVSKASADAINAVLSAFKGMQPDALNALSGFSGASFSGLKDLENITIDTNGVQSIVNAGVNLGSVAKNYQDVADALKQIAASAASTPNLNNILSKGLSGEKASKKMVDDAAKRAELISKAEIFAKTQSDFISKYQSTQGAGSQFTNLQDMVQLVSNLRDGLIDGTINDDNLNHAAKALSNFGLEAKKVKSEIKGLFDSQQSDDKDNFTRNITKRTEAVKKLSNILNTVRQYQTKYARSETSKDSDVTKAFSDLATIGADAQKYLDGINSGTITEVGDTLKEISKLESDLSNSGTVLKTKGVEGASWFSTITGSISRYAAQFTTAGAVRAAYRTMKEMVKSSIEMNDVMTQLRIVTKASDKEMEAYGKTAFDTAKNLGVSAKDIVTATTSYSRLGYTLQESSQLASLTTMLQSVGDISAEDAQSSITAIVKAYDVGVNDLELIMDKLVAVGNGAPISVSELATGMNNAGSALKEAGSDFDQSVALLTAANTTVQNASKSSTGLRTIVARLRKTKTELDDLGETMTDAEYDSIVEALTNITTADGRSLKVSLKDANGELRKSYDILKDLSNAWDQMDENSRAALAQTIGQTRNRNIFASLMDNFDEAEKAMALMDGASGELQNSYKIYQESVSSHLESLRSAFSELSADLVKAGAANFFIDIGKNIVEGIDSLVVGLQPIIDFFDGLIETSEEADAAVGEYTSDYENHLSNVSKLTAEVTKLREKYNSLISDGTASEKSGQELEALRKEISITEARIRVEQKAAENSFSDASDAIINAYKKKFNYAINADRTDKLLNDGYINGDPSTVANSPGGRSYIGDYDLSAYLARIERLRATISVLDKSSADYDKKLVSMTDRLNSYESHVVEKAGEMVDLRDQVLALTDGKPLTQDQRDFFADIDSRLAHINNVLGTDIGIEFDRAEDLQQTSDAVSSSIESSAESIRKLLDETWRSEDFKSAREELTKLSKTEDGISDKKIKELAQSSEDLDKILKESGVDAQLLAKAFEMQAIDGNGFDFITDDLLELNAALNTAADLFDAVSDAIERYNEAASTDYDAEFKNFSSIYEATMSEIKQGRTGKKFWAGAEALLGADTLENLDYDVASVINYIKAMQSYTDAEIGSLKLLSDLSDMADSNGNIFGNDGSVIATITKDGDLVKPLITDISALAEKLHVSDEFLAASTKSWGVYGDVSYMETERVIKKLEDMGAASGQFNKVAINADAAEKTIGDLNKTSKETHDIMQTLRRDSGSVFVSANDSAVDFADKLVDIGIASRDAGGNITVVGDDLAGLMKDLSFTEEQAVSMADSLYGLSNLKITDAVGNQINSIDFTKFYKPVELNTGDIEDKEAKAIFDDNIDEINAKKLNDKHAKAYFDDVYSGKSGKFDSNAKGTKNAPGGPSLVGEEGEELVWSGNRAYFVGTHGPEIVNLQPGDTVYTADETKKIKRGNAPKVLNSYAGGLYSNAKNTAGAIVAGIIDLSKLLKGKDNSGGSNSSAPQPAQVKEEDKVDWIVRAIKAIERQVNSLNKIASSTFKNISSRLTASKDQIATVTREIDLQRRAAERYRAEAESIDLSADLKQLVREGTVDINAYDEATRKLITAYQNWYDKSTDAADAVDDLHESLAQLYQGNFNNIKADFENQLDVIQRDAEDIENMISMMETQGYLGATKYYEATIASNEKSISRMQKELVSLQQSFRDAMASGEIQENSEAWYEMQGAIRDVKTQIDEMNLSIAETNNKIRDLNWEYFDYGIDRISQITDEAEFLIDLMEDSDLFDEVGNATSKGMASMALRGERMNLYMGQADQYAKEILRLDREIANDPYNTTLLERRQEMLDNQRESILAAQDEKRAIQDLVRDGIEKQLDAMNDLIDKYNDSLDSAKNLYEYQKKVQDESENIRNIQKQLSAYEGDLSEESRARMQKLTTDLSDARDRLQQTEYSQYISDQKDLLGNLYDEYETVLNERLDNIDALVQDVIDEINSNGRSIRDTLKEVSSSVGYSMTNATDKIWANSSVSLDGAITTYGTDFSQKLTSVNASLTAILYGVTAMAEHSNSVALGAIPQFKNGGLASFTGLAKLDGTAGAPEVVLNARDSSNLIALRDMLRMNPNFASAGSDAAYRMLSAPALSILENSAKLAAAVSRANDGNGFGGNDITVNIDIDHVENYEDFMNKMRSDANFGKMVQAITTDKLKGGNSIAKNKYKW